MSFARASDYDLYIRIAAHHGVTIVKQRLIRWRCLPTSVSGPRRLRGFRYLPEEIEITKKHLRLSSGAERILLRRIVRSKLAVGAERLYYYGLETDRAFATRALWQLLTENISSPRAAAFLLGLWCPPAITRTFGQMVRRLFFKNCSTAQNAS
jgi:hypothetical protein